MVELEITQPMNNVQWFNLSADGKNAGNVWGAATVRHFSHLGYQVIVRDRAEAIIAFLWVDAIKKAINYRREDQKPGHETGKTREKART